MPFLWSQIINAASHPFIGWQMNGSQIVSLLKQGDPITFMKLSHTTMEAWIDCTGGKPKWSIHVLQKANEGNDPGLGNKRGRQGIFVRHSLFDSQIVSLISIVGALPHCRESNHQSVKYIMQQICVTHLGYDKRDHCGNADEQSTRNLQHWSPRWVIFPVLRLLFTSMAS